jgi:hypothetical protein
MHFGVFSHHAAAGTPNMHNNARRPQQKQNKKKK